LWRWLYAFCKHEGDINAKGYSVIMIRTISDIKRRKITLLKLEKAEVGHTRRLLCCIARYLTVDYHKPGTAAEAPV